ncbi:MAG: hypothetical protein A2270_07870 [Elusimicrobia bacterium RIFOXYA12_FULL_51_18]|nr:MAG: hypothetical protein A2270_07870 [Elusimicrobia bacterium RIFOXYA12_FULL_51_18]OGS29978.1 MAG: hypothetical protein A2218_12540 [Elusimicrobia bacterium RIFOXYA2_FULL_53_38]
MKKNWGKMLEAGTAGQAALSSAYIFRCLLYIIFPLFIPCSSSAGGPGSTSVQILKTDMSPRAMGMAGSFVAVADDIYTVNYNPAGSGQLYIPEASAMYLTGFEDSKLQFLGFGMPLPVIGLAGVEKAGMAVSAIFSQSGKFTYRRIEPDGNISSRDMDAETTRVLSLSYGEKIYSGDIKIEGYNAAIDQYLGLSAKYISSELLETYSASALAFDAGWLVREPNLGLTFGASLSNYGKGVKYLNETSPLPAILRLGLSYEKPTFMDQSVLLVMENDIYLKESLKSLRVGLEYHFEKIFNFRLGYKAMEDNKGPTMGLGVHHEGFALDFALSLANEVFNTSQVAFTYKFTGWRVGSYKKNTHYRDQEDTHAKPEKADKPAAPAKKEPVKPKGQREPDKKKDSGFFWID